MSHAPYLPYRWCNERGYLTHYQSLLLLSGNEYGKEWEQIEFETFLERKFPDLLRSYRWKQKKKRLQKYLKGIFSSFKSFLRV